MLLKCALEETLTAWMWRLSSASLKDRRKIAEEETWGQFVSFSVLFALGGGIYNLQRSGDLGVGKLPCLMTFPQYWFLWDSHQGYRSSPSSFCLHLSEGMTTASFCVRVPCTAPWEILLFRLCSRLRGRICVIWSAVVVCQSLLSPLCWGQVWDHMQELLLEQSECSGFVELRKTSPAWAANTALLLSPKTH